MGFSGTVAAKPENVSETQGNHFPDTQPVCSDKAGHAVVSIHETTRPYVSSPKSKLVDFDHDL